MVHSTTFKRTHILNSSASSPSNAVSQPSPWQIGLQDSVTPVMDEIAWFHTGLVYIITAIAVFVLKSRNAEPGN